MIDLVFLAHNRLEFTRASLAALKANTDWSQVGRIIKYVDIGPDGHDDGTADLVVGWGRGATTYTRIANFGGPVLIMQEYLREFGRPDGVFCKIDNDVIVPPGWWTAGADVMARNPQLDLLGIEPPASRTRSPYGGKLSVCAESDWKPTDPIPHFVPCDSIGGIGFMRVSAFRNGTMRQHSTYGGFTDWQLAHRQVSKGWIVPPLKLFLLDRLPIEPWASLSKDYIDQKWQRMWTRYPETAAPYLWDWWLSHPARDVR